MEDCWRAINKIESDQASHSRKQQTARPHSVLSHQRPVSVGLHCQARCDYYHKDSAAYTVSTSSLTMEVEAVTYALRWIASRGDSQTTHVIVLTASMSLLQKVKSGMGNPDWNVSVVDIHLRKLLLVCCIVHAGVKGNGRADRLTGKATLTSGLRLRRSEVLRSLRHYLRAQCQGHYTIDRLEERGVERGSARRFSLKGRERAIINQTNIETVPKVTLEKRLTDGVERIWLFRVHRFHFELN